MGIIYSGLSYGTGTAPTNYGVSAKTYAETTKTTKEMSWMLADRVAGLSLSDWAIIVGIAYAVIICAVNWHYRKKEREDRLNGNVTEAEK